MTNPSIEEVVRDTRSRNLLIEHGYNTYNDLKTLSYDDIKSMEGLGGVCGIRAYEQIQEYRKVLYKELLEKTKDVADKIGVEKVFELLESLENDEC